MMTTLLNCRTTINLKNVFRRWSNHDPQMLLGFPCRFPHFWDGFMPINPQDLSKCWCISKDDLVRIILFMFKSLHNHHYHTSRRAHPIFKSPGRGDEAIFNTLVFLKWHSGVFKKCEGSHKTFLTNEDMCNDND